MYVCMYACMYVCMYVCLSVYLSIYLSIYLFMCLSIYLYIRLSNYLSIYCMCLSVTTCPNRGFLLSLTMTLMLLLHLFYTFRFPDWWWMIMCSAQSAWIHFNSLWQSHAVTPSARSASPNSGMAGTKTSNVLFVKQPLTQGLSWIATCLCRC